MAHIITLKDGSNHTIFDKKDFEHLVEEYLGHEALGCYLAILEEESADGIE